LEKNQTHHQKQKINLVVGGALALDSTTFVERTFLVTGSEGLIRVAFDFFISKILFKIISNSKN